MCPKILVALLLLGATSAQAGLFDEMLNKAKSVTEKTVKQTIDQVSGADEEPNEKSASEPTAAAKPATSPPPVSKHTYDSQLVRDIQQRLSALGYDVGVVDGLYGKGTRSAIIAYQEHQGIVADGRATPALLQRLKSAATGLEQGQATAGSSVVKSSPSPDKGPSDGAVLPTPASVQRAVLSYHPDVLADERILKESVSRIYPQEWLEVAHDEFAWQKRRAAFRSRIQAEIADPPLTFEVAPWWRKAKGGRVALGKYDFKRQAFAVRALLVDIPTSGYDSRPFYREMGLDQIRWLPMSAEQAETLAGYETFNSHGRNLYARFTITVTGAKKYTSHGKLKLYPEISMSDIRLYRFTQAQGPAKGPESYQYVATLALSAPKSESTAEVKQPSYSIPEGVNLLQGDALRAALLGNTVEGVNWAVYFGTDGQVDTLWQRQAKRAGYRIEDPLICFEEGAEIATSDCVAVSRDDSGQLRFYELYRGKQLIPYRLAPGPFPKAASVRSGRIDGLLDPEGHLKAAEADILGIRLGMALTEADELVRRHRSDMQRYTYDGHGHSNVTPWAQGMVHVRYEAPDGREVIGIQSEPPTAGNRVTLVWRTLSYSIETGAPEEEVVIRALFDKYGGTIPAKSNGVFSWINNGGGLKSRMGCHSQPNPLPAPLSKPGPLNHIDDRCGESVTAYLSSRDGLVTGVQLYLVNQANLQRIVEANKRVHQANTAKAAPTF